MIFQNLSIAGKPGFYDISIENDLISRIDPAGYLDKNSLGIKVDFQDSMAFPGLINSHDHLDFNLFPQFGNKTFTNYQDWGHEIHKIFKPEIEQIIEIPQALRTDWGIYKNLVNGFTTVINHGNPLQVSNPPILVIQETNILHSVGFEKNWIWKLNNPFAGKQPFVVHVGEGTDKRAADEISKLIRWNLLNRKLIGVHGVAMTANQAKKFEALVWCPESNFFMLGRTADIPVIGKSTRILFGTDSTLTASWNAWDHFRRARSISGVDDQELFGMMTINAANCWDLPLKGSLNAGMKADLAIGRTKGPPSWDSFYALNPSDILIVLHEGKIRLFDAEIEPTIASTVDFPMDKFSKIRIGKNEKFVFGDLPLLMRKIKAHYPKFDPDWERTEMSGEWIK